MPGQPGPSQKRTGRTGTRGSPTRSSWMPIIITSACNPAAQHWRSASKPFDLTRAGVYGDSAWVKEAQAPLPPTVFAPEPPSLAIHDDFEATAVSAGGAYVPDGATAYHEGRPELIAYGSDGHKRQAEPQGHGCLGLEVRL